MLNLQSTSQKLIHLWNALRVSIPHSPIYMEETRRRAHTACTFGSRMGGLPGFPLHTQTIPLNFIMSPPLSSNRTCIWG